MLFKGKSIADVLDMTGEEAADFFMRCSNRETFKTLHRVGLDYIHVGQQESHHALRRRSPASSSQRSCQSAPPAALYILDEPTTGLHFHDVAKLLEVLHELVAQGNTVVVIEHNLEAIKTADWVIDLGPEQWRRRRRNRRLGPPEDIESAKDTRENSWRRCWRRRRRREEAQWRERGGGAVFLLRPTKLAQHPQA